VLASFFAGLIFAGILLTASKYVAMDDPQLPSRALQILALLLLARLRPATIAAALLMAGAIFVKHNLVAMPLATAIWLVERDSKEADASSLRDWPPAQPGSRDFAYLSASSTGADFLAPHHHRRKLNNVVVGGAFQLALGRAPMRPHRCAPPAPCYQRKRNVS
jgi:hypothetical protein